MYLRPQQCFEKYLVAEKISRLDERGREIIEFKPTEAQILAAVSTLKPYEAERFKKISMKVDFVLAERARLPKANLSDLLIHNDEKYLIQHVENILGQWTLYYVERRFDL